MSQHLVFSGMCATSSGELIFAKERPFGREMAVCPDCGCALPDFPRPRMTMEALFGSRRVLEKSAFRYERRVLYAGEAHTFGRGLPQDGEW
jgi:hypothetical protein